MEFMHVPVNFPAIHDYYGIIILLIIILVITVLWSVWKTGKCYANLPSCYTFCFELVYEYFANKTKPFADVIFQKLNAVSKQFEKEGIVHIWCFRHVLVIFGEEAVKVLATDEACAEKPADYGIIKDAFGDGLLVLDVETWKKERKLLNPLFSVGNLKAHIPIFNENAKIMIKKLENSADKPVVDLMPFLEYCVYHNICESIFDVNMKDKFSEMEIEEIFELITGSEKYLSSKWFLPPMVAKLHRFCSPSGWKDMKMNQELKQYGLRIISSAIESISRKSCNSKKDLDLNRTSIVHTLLQHQLNDTSVPPSHLKDHVFSLLVAGTDPVLITMMWCLYMLGLHKDVQKEAYDEIQSVADEFITYENLSQLEYLDCIIKETLRLYPTVPAFARSLKKDLQCGNRTVPKDTTILFFLYRLHRNPEIYPDPENFDPDRFRSTNEEKRRWAHIPFSEGYRNCIGKKFAEMEMKVTLAYILQNYEITSLDRREDLDLQWNIFLLPTKRLRMRITRR